jgi:hypothetical protein
VRYTLVLLLCAFSAGLAQRLGDYAAGPSIMIQENMNVVLFHAQAGFSGAWGGLDLAGSAGQANLASTDAEVQSIGVVYHSRYHRSGSWDPFGGLSYMHAGTSESQAHGLGIAGGLQYLTDDDNLFRPSVQISMIEGGTDEPVALGAEWQWVWRYFYLGFAASASFEDIGLGAGMGWRLGDD